MLVFGNPMSTCTRKVLTVLGEKGAPFDFVTIDFQKGEHKAPAHVARQPFGQVPAFEDGDLKLFESRAIIRYLDAKLPGVSLTPTNLADRARMEQWMSVEQSNFSPPMMKIFMQRVFVPMMGGATNEALVTEGYAGTEKALDVLETHLAGGKKFLVGDAFSLADVCYMPYLEYLGPAKAGDLITSRPNVNGWWENLRSRASWKKVSG